MRNIFAVAAVGVLALVGFAGAAHSSATIDLIWDATGTDQIDDSGDREIQLNVIFTAGPAGSEGAGVSVDFSSIAEGASVIDIDNTPSDGAGSPLPIELDSPLIQGTRVELINSICICDLGYGTGLEPGQSQQLGYVTFDIAPPGIDPLVNGTYPILSDADGPSDGVLDGNGDEILPKTDITFNSAFITIPEPGALPVLGSGIAALALLYRRRRYSVEP